MTKIRSIDSVEDALMQAIGLLGLPRIIAVTGRKASQVKAWSDPDDGRRAIPLACALLIDRELKADGHEPLFLAWFETQMRGHAIAAGEAAESPVTAAMRTTSEAADVMDRIDAAMADGQLQPHELISCRAAVGSLQKRCARLMRTLVPSKAPAGGRAF